MPTPADLHRSIQAGMLFTSLRCPPARLRAAGDACVQRCGRAAACNPLCLEALRQQLGPSRSTAVLQQQHLFSVYVHARPTLKDYKEPSAFAGRLIPDRAVRGACHAMHAAATQGGCSDHMRMCCMLRQRGGELLQGA